MKAKKNTGSFFDRNSKHFLFFLIVLNGIVIDQVIKILIRLNFLQGEGFSVIGDFFNITYIQNTGGGFGFLSGFNYLFVIITLLVIGLIFYYYKSIKEEEKLLFFSSAFLLSGAFGNLIDRVVLGYVVDFLNFSFWPAFNVADMLICAGVVGLVIYFWKK